MCYCCWQCGTARRYDYTCFTSSQNGVQTFRRRRLVHTMSLRVVMEVVLTRDEDVMDMMTVRTDLMNSSVVRHSFTYLLCYPCLCYAAIRLLVCLSVRSML